VNVRGVHATLAAFAVLASSAASAQTYTWIGPPGGVWSTATNWSPTGPPSGLGPNVVFTGASTSVVDTGSSLIVGTLSTTGSGVANISASALNALSIAFGISQVGASLDISAPITIALGSQPWTFSGTNTFSGNIGTNSFLMNGPGTLVLSGADNNFTAATVNSGTLQAITVTALGAATITLAGGTLSLAGPSAFATPASVVASASSNLTVAGPGYSVANLTVNSGVALDISPNSVSIPGTLAGSGTVIGAVALPANANLTPGTGGTGSLSVGTLTLASTTQLNYTVGASTTLLIVNTPLTVNGVVNIAGSTPPAAGDYTLIQGSATVTAGTVTIGTVPSGASYGLTVSGSTMVLTVGPAPTAVGMTAREAVSDGHASYLTWKTGFETRNLGYHVYRQDGAVRTLLTPGLIAGSALRATADLKVGHSYTWVDATSPTGSTYWIESIDLNGKSVMFGPTTAHPGPTPNSRSSPLLSDSTRSSALVRQTQPLVHLRSADSPPVLGDLAQQWLNAAGSAAKVLVRDSGVYRVPAEQLFTSGIPVGADASAIQLWTSGAPVSFRAITADGAHLQPGDAIEFYGHGIDTRYSNTRLYWVTAGLGGQQLMTTQAPVATADAGRSFAETLEIRQRLYYFSAIKNGGAEKFFGPQVPSTGLARIFPTPALDVFSSSSGALTVAVQGLSAGPHSISVVLNGVLLGTLTGVNTNLMSKTFLVPVAQLIAGDNTVVLVAQSTTDIDVESYQQLSYPRQYVGLGTPLQFTAPGGSSVHLQDFGVQTTRVFDITNLEASVELSLSVDPANQNGSVVNVPSSSETHTLYAFQAGGEIPLLDVQPNVASQWHSFGGAQLVIIAHASLLPAIQPLVEQRQREGLTVATVDVQDVYDEFSFGEKDAGAIRAFLQYAAQKWAIAPRYVLLVGGATYDPRDYLNNPGLDLVPTNLIETVFLETGSDGAFVDFAAPRSAGIAIGRWPVTSPSDAALVMNKTLGRVPLTSKSSLLLVHDTDGTTKFSEASAQVRSAVSPWLVQEIARGTGTDAAIHTAVIAAMRSGPAALDYQGHGAEDFWNGNLLSDEDTSALANAGQSLLFSAATCFNGYFVDIGRTSLAQAMLLTEGGGAWAAWASSGMTSPVEHSQLSSDLLEAAVVEGLTLGDASVRAKSTITDPDVRSTFHLFGDPSARMAPAVAGALTAPGASGIHSHVATGCGTPGPLALAVLPWVILALLLSARPRRVTTVRALRR
jgi:autotransporter-associated beta strand protein